MSDQQEKLNSKNIIQQTVQMRHRLSVILALSGAMHHGIPWHRAVYLRAMEDRTYLKCDLGGIRAHAIRKSALVEKS